MEKSLKHSNLKIKIFKLHRAVPIQTALIVNGGICWNEGGDTKGSGEWFILPFL